MEGVSADIVAVEVEAVVLIVIPATRSAHAVVAVSLGEVISISMIGVGGLEVLDEGVEAEALGEGEIGAQPGKEVLREGQRLNNGTRKGNRENQEEAIAVQEGGEIGAPLEKVVLKEGQ